MKNVAITGLGFITSIGNDYASVKDSLVNLRNGIAVYPPFENDAIPVKCAGTVKDFDVSSTDQEDWIYPPQYRVRRDVLRAMADRKSVV